MYLWLRLIHIVGAAVLFGTGLGIAYFMLRAHLSRDVRAIAHTARQVVVADWLFTATAVVIQPVTGVLLWREVGYPWDAPWLLLSAALFVLTGACWLPVVWLQYRMRDMADAAAAEGTELPAQYRAYFRLWFALGWPALIAVLAIFWLMVFRPDF